MKGDC